ncbi:hypothetical protein [Clostridium sp. C8]|uniref:hypothetical protein n=1 Tax=Clostridium sp. C8 TaxID=1667357 RepID=UPI00062E45C2|nr:hypothetical protein [Clostridium sp. C8]KLE14806.1 hypothetical protein AAT22_15090 [Clostridium sp. C8]
MKILKSLKDKKLGVYLRKESPAENIITGYGRLQWLKYELEEYKGDKKFFIDRSNEDTNLNFLIKAIKSKEIEAVLIWTLDDIDLNLINSLWVTCFMNEIQLISFYEGVIETKDIINTYTGQFSITR